MIFLSLVFFYLLKKASENDHKQSIVIVKSILSEEENLMNTEKNILNRYQTTFKKCNHQINFPLSTNHNEFNSKDDLNLNKTINNKYSQIKYSKVKEIDKEDIDENEIELKCHQDDFNNLTDNKLNLDYNIKKDKLINNSIKSIDKSNSSIDNSTNNPNYDPNYDLNYKDLNCNVKYNNCNKLTPSTSSDDNSSPNLNDDNLLNRNLIHPKKISK